MNYLLTILIIAVLASQATIWHSLATIRDAIQRPAAATSGRVRLLPIAARSSLVRSWYVNGQQMDSRVGLAALIPVG